MNSSLIIGISFLLFLGFLFLYNASKRTQIQRNSIGLWLFSNPKLSKILGVLFLALGFYFIISISGFGTGIFFGLGLLMLIASLVILLFPLYNFKKHKK